MLIKPDWNIFKVNFSENPQAAFEWMCYLLFCREFNKPRGIFRYENHPALETEPIKSGDNIIGFQAKYFTANLTERKKEIKEAIIKIIDRYPNITKLLFFTNKDWTSSNNKEKILATNTQRELELFAISKKISIEWRTEYYFESEDVVLKNGDITQYFFDIKTNEYYEKIRKTEEQKTGIDENKIYTTSIFIDSNKEPIYGKGILSDYIVEQLKNSELNNLKNIFITGVAGIGKSTEMKMSFNNLIKKCSNENCYQVFRFLPVPYFYELKNYQTGCLKVGEKETPLLFLDGLDEIPSSQLISFIKELANIKSQNSSVRFIISGRDASFVNEIREIAHTDIRLSSYIDEDLQWLIYKFRGTIFESFLTIPFYRNFISTLDLSNIKTNKEFIKSLITTRLMEDKRRMKRGENIPSFCHSEKEIDLEKIQNKIAVFSFVLFKEKRRFFSQKELQHIITSNDDYFFVLYSSLFDYKDENNISFVSNIFFEYFLARYYAKQAFSTINKTFFLPTGKVIVSHINIISMLLNLLDSKSRKYKQIINKLNKETSAYVLLTDFILLSPQERFLSYKTIINEFNQRDKLIYYINFRHSYDLLKNINSMSDAMHNLLPKEYYNETIEYHSQTIKDFLDNPIEKKKMSFMNSLILLGAHRKYWEIEQQTKLKEIAVLLIQFFLSNDLAKTMHGLLSEDTILQWYEDYEWTIGWKAREWDSFLKDIGLDNEDFYTFKTEHEYKFKLKLFIHFFNNEYINILLVPLAIHLLTADQDEQYGSFVPRKLNDEVKTPVSHSDSDLFYYEQIIKESNINNKDIIQILFSATQKHLEHEFSFRGNDIYEVLLNKLKNNITIMSDEDVPYFYGILKIYLETDFSTHLSELDDFLQKIDDIQKQVLCNCLFEDLKQNKYRDHIFFLSRTITILLFQKNIKNAKELLLELKNDFSDCYRTVISVINNDKGHPLFEFAAEEYPKLFAKQIRIEQEHENRLNTFFTKKKAMQEKEFNIITEKELLIDEIKNILVYLDDNEKFPDNDSDRGKLLDLQAEHIENMIRFDYENKYSEPQIFSSFAIKLLFNSTDKDKKLNPKYIFNCIEGWFAEENYFWRYFFWLYINNFKKEETNVFLQEHPQIIEKINISMQNEVSSFVEEQDISIYDNGQNRAWVTPFVYYISKLYNNKLPVWFNQSKIYNFIAFPSWCLSTGHEVFLNSNFKWETWSSIFEWIQEISGIKEDELIKEALRILPIVKSDLSQSQIITIFVEKVKTDSKNKQQMLSAIIDKTRIEIQKEYKDHNEKSIMNSGALSDFWRETDEDIIEKILPYINFEKYDPEDINYCRRIVMEYFCKKASSAQKKMVIKSLKNKINIPNVRNYLAKLGCSKAIVAIIDAFLKGEDWDDHLAFYGSICGKTRKSIYLLYKYCELYTYSLEKDNDRRHYLYDLAKRGILDTVSRKSFFLARFLLNRTVTRRKKTGLYHEGITDFINEIEQAVYGERY